jgi:hypothetical protein
LRDGVTVRVSRRTVQNIANTADCIRGSDGEDLDDSAEAPSGGDYQERFVLVDVGRSH